MQKYRDVVLDRFGNAQVGASVQVNLNGAAATLYSDDGVTQTANPLTTDANGEFEFYVADGMYDIIISGANITTQTISDVRIGEVVSVRDFGAVGDGVTDDTAAFTAAAAATRFIFVPYSASGYKVANTVVIGSSQCIFAGGFPTTQLVGTATATDVNAIAFNSGQVSARRMRIEPKVNQLTGTNEGGMRGLFISQSEPNTSSVDYGDGPWYFNEITTEWTGTRTGSGGVGSSTSATVQGLRVGLDVGGADYDLASASAFGSGLIHTTDDTSDGDKLGANSGVLTSATSPGKVYGASSAVTVDTGGETPQAIGHEVDMFINVATGVPKALGYNAWSGGTQNATATYAAYGISRSGAGSAVPWDYGFCLYTSGGSLPQPIISTGSMFATDDPDPITLANFVYYPTMVINGDILKFPNAVLSGAGRMTLDVGYDFSESTAATANSTSKLLADYEEGRYAATATPSTSGSITLVSATDSLSYTKIGNRVFVSGQINVDSVSSPVGYVQISMPYACLNAPEGAGHSAGKVVASSVVSSNIADFVLQIDEGNSYASLYLGAGTSIQGSSAQQIQAGTTIKISIDYPV